MADISPASEKNVVVTNSHLGRLWTLTIVSLVLNGFILFLILLGAILHHHPRHHGFTGRDGGRGGRAEGQCPMGCGLGFHHFGMGKQAWGDPDGGPRQPGGPGNAGPGPGGLPPAKPGSMGGPSPGGSASAMPGMGRMPGMMGGFMGKPDPAKMTDMILDHLTTMLSLTDDQKAKIKPIVEQQLADIQKQMEAQHQAMQKQIEDAKAKIKPLLNADQQKQLDAMRLPGQKPPGSDGEDSAPMPGQ